MDTELIASVFYAHFKKPSEPSWNDAPEVWRRHYLNMAANVRPWAECGEDVLAHVIVGGVGMFAVTDEGFFGPVPQVTH